MTYIKVSIKSINRKDIVTYTEDTEVKVFRSKKKFYDFCLSFFSPVKTVSYTVFTYPQNWYQQWLSSAPYPIIYEERSIQIIKSDVKLNSYYADKYDQYLQTLIHSR